MKPDPIGQYYINYGTWLGENQDKLIESIMGNDMHKCTQCNMSFTREFFYKNDHYASGYSMACKECIREKSKKRYQDKNIEKSTHKIDRYVHYLKLHGYVVMRKLRKIA